MSSLFVVLFCWLALVVVFLWVVGAVVLGACPCCFSSASVWGVRSVARLSHALSPELLNQANFGVAVQYLPFHSMEHSSTLSEYLLQTTTAKQKGHKAEKAVDLFA